MIKLRHNDTLTFNYLSKFNGELPAVYRIYSAISEALEAGANPGAVKDQIMLDRVQASVGGRLVQNGDQIMVEGKYFTLKIENEAAQLALIT